MLQPMRTQILTDALRALSFGFVPFEKVWMADGNRVVLQKLKPLLPEVTQILVDDHGNFLGFLARNSPVILPLIFWAPRRLFTPATASAEISTAAAGMKMSARSGRRRCRPRSGWLSITKKSPA